MVTEKATGYYRHRKEESARHLKGTIHIHWYFRSKNRVNLAKLKAKGLIERIGAAKGGYWKVKEVP